MKKMAAFKYTMDVMIHGYIVLTILSFLTLPNQIAIFLGSYSLLNSFIGFMAFENVIKQIASLAYFFAFSISLIVVYIKAIVRRLYNGMITIIIIDCVTGLVFLFQRIIVDAFDGFHLVAVLLRILYSIIFYCTIKTQRNCKYFD